MRAEARKLRDTFADLPAWLPVFASYPYALQPSEFWGMRCEDFLAFRAHRDRLLKNARA
jgi:hypothetical protein